MFTSCYNDTEISQGYQQHMWDELCHIVVGVGVVFVSLHVVSVDEGLYPLLQVCRFNWKLQLIVQFSDQKVMWQDFPHFHDPNNGSINLILPVLEYSFLCLLLLFTRFLHLDLVNSDAEELIGELLVVKEFIIIMDILASRVFL